MIKIQKLFQGILFALLILTVGALIISQINVFKNYKLLAVQSGSMEPTIKKNAIILIKAETNYQIGDIITVVKPASPKTSLTHRIIKIEKEDGKIVYITKGDANKSQDTEKRLKENVIGKTIFTIPYIGFFILLAKTKEGLIGLIIIPGTLIIYNEILNIKNEVRNMISGKSKKKKNKKYKLKSYAFLIILFALFLTHSGLTNSYLSAQNTATVSLTAGIFESSFDSSAEKQENSSSPEEIIPLTITLTNGGNTEATESSEINEEVTPPPQESPTPTPEEKITEPTPTIIPTITEQTPTDEPTPSPEIAPENLE